MSRFFNWEPCLITIWVLTSKKLLIPKTLDWENISSNTMGSVWPHW
jgi:hypothetical protein